MAERCVWITGAGGFLAAALLPAARRRWPGACIVGVGRRAAGGGFDAAAGLDLLDGAALAAAARTWRPDVVLHAAGRVVATGWATLQRDNLEATVALLDALAAAAPAARIVVAGSAAECGLVDGARLPLTEDTPLRPVTDYGVAKACQTLAALARAERGQAVAVARIFNITGRGTPIYTSLGAFAAQLRAIAAGTRPPRLAVGNLSPQRDLLDVDDVADAMCALAGHDLAGRLYNVCSGRPVGIDDALEQLIALSGLQVQVEVDPALLRPVDVPCAYGSPARLQAATGWLPRIPLQASLAAMLAG